MSSKKFKRKDKSINRDKFANFDANTFEKQKAEDIENKKIEEELQERKAAFDKVKTLKEKIRLAKEKNRELDSKFLKRRKEFKSSTEFKNAYVENKNKRTEVINKLESEYEQELANYRTNYELGTYRFKRWFFGMGKEFSRISWLSKKEVMTGFIIVFFTSVTLALIFFIIEMIITYAK